ncbi:MAG: cation/H(+) antiporter [Halioglobus sp.]|nr:cation/H(+) antiporter [Halioglobus sp.]|tara:strand:- start:27173 stop:28336 length:1164 start_codon:yes stop_codon:yes gene_type:complete
MLTIDTLIWLLSGAVLVASNALFDRYRLPLAAVVILLGMLLGPLWLELISFGSEERIITEIVVVFILFAAGYEVNWKRFIAAVQPALIVGIAGILASASLGYIAGFTINGRIDEALYIAVALAATSIGISVPLLSREGILHTKVGQIFLAAAVVDDILALYLLSSIHLSLTGTNGYQQILTSLLIGILALLAIIMLLSAVYVLLNRSGMLKSTISRRSAIISLTLLTAWLTHLGGLSAAVGGFVAGAVLAAMEPEKRGRDSAFFDRLAACVTPLFFVGIGMQITELDVNDLGLLYVVLLVLIAAILGKLFVPWLISSQLNVRERWILGAALLPRGEVGLVVASIGLMQKHLSHHGMVSLVIMTLVTALASSIIIPRLARSYTARGND